MVGQIQCAGVATAEHQGLHRQPARRRQIGRVGDDLGDSAESGGLGEVSVRRHQHRHTAQPGQRRNGHHRAGAGVHQDPDPGALPHTDLNEPAHHIVDTAIDGLIGVDASVEQQELAVGYRLRLLRNDAPQRDSGVVIDLTEPNQTWQGARGLDGEGADGLVGADHGIGRSAGDRHGQLGCLGDTVHHPRTQRHPGLTGIRRGVRHG